VSAARSGLGIRAGVGQTRRDDLPKQQALSVLLKRFVCLSLGLGYVHNADGVTKDWIDSGSWEVELVWKRHPARVQFQSFYDPKGLRIKA
jgi:hypothetical protein